MEQPPKISAAVLDPEHYHPLISAIRNLLSTDLAAITFAQLIDGLPLVDTVWDMRGSLLLQGHPLINHDHLCDGAMEQLKAFRDVSEPDALTFDSRVRPSDPHLPTCNAELLPGYAAVSKCRAWFSRFQHASC